MKTLKISWLCLSVFLIGMVTGNATEVSQARLRKAAGNFYEERIIAMTPVRTVNSNILSEFAIRRDSKNVCQIFNFSGGGWVLLSSDDRAMPVLAYNLTGNIEPDQGSPELQWWLDRCADQILECINSNLPASTETTERWNALIAGTFRASDKGAKNIQPLLTSTWDQGNFYNYYCPEDPGGPGGRVWAGCVATSMSQIMYYYRYPLQGTGTHGYYSDYGYLDADFGSATYDFDAMRDNIGGNYNLPMALLQYHCGVAVDMNYNPEGSGAYMDDATQAMKQHFGYAATATLKYKNSYTDLEWENMLIAELDANRPLSYAGFSATGGHAFVCDGYDGTGRFHFNWGWSGYGDGYFYVNGVSPTIDYNDGQQAIFDLYPATAFPYGCAGTKTLTTNQGTIEDGSGPLANYSANGDCMWLIDPATSADPIRLSFSRFMTESSNDVVTIYDGATTADSVLGVFSGPGIPPEVVSTGGKLLIRFTTNGTTQDAGWLASFQPIPLDYCSNLAELTAASGAFGDGSGASEYHTGTACRWRIAPAGATGITINFTSFDLEGNDFVTLFDGASGTSIETFRGNELPLSMFVFSSQAIVFFMSDGFGTAQGFDATYTSSTSGIADENNASAILVYPNPSGDNMHFSATAINGPVEISLVSPTGSEMLRVSGLPENGEFHYDLDVSDLAPGLYLIVFEHEGTRQIQRVSVMH